MSVSMMPLVKDIKNLHNGAPLGLGEKPYLSPSAVTTLRTDPARWFFRNVLKIPEEKGIEAYEGTAVHEAVEWAARSVMSQNLGNPSGVLAAVVGKEAAARLPVLLEKAMGYKELRLEDQHPEAWELSKVKVGKLAETAWAWLVGQDVKLLGVEVAWLRDMGVYCGHGRVDLIVLHENVIKVLDLKTSTRAPSDIKPAHAIQDLSYVQGLNANFQGYGLPSPVTHAGILTVAATAKATTAYLTGIKVSKESLEWCDREWAAAYRAVAEGHLEPNPMGADWLCKPGVCGYFEKCQGSMRLVTP